MGYKASDIVKSRFDLLKAELVRQQALVQEQKRKTERSMIGWSFNNYLLSEAPLAADGMTGYAVAFITNGRKAGEGAGNGTGILAYYSPNTDEWLAVRTDTAVTT